MVEIPKNILKLLKNTNFKKVQKSLKRFKEVISSKNTKKVQKVKRFKTVYKKIFSHESALSKAAHDIWVFVG